MKTLKFIDSEFSCSVSEGPSYLPEIAIVGRSNVGKSSLINHLLNKKTAKVSATPGKTKTVNFFKIDNKINLVDLPGYGFAKVDKKQKNIWAKSVDHYLLNTKNLQLFLLLIDIRRKPTDHDILFYSWALEKNIPIILIFTKCDKAKSKELNINTQNTINTFVKINNKAIKYFIHYSIKDNKGKKALIYHINKHLFSGENK